MHSGPMSDSAGKFRPGCNEMHDCRKCKAKTARCELWESSCGGFEDVKYTCIAVGCGHVWWVDGIDS